MSFDKSSEEFEKLIQQAEIAHSVVSEMENELLEAKMSGENW